MAALKGTLPAKRAKAYKNAGPADDMRVAMVDRRKKKRCEASELE
jgi:hypothetical protein